MLCGRVTLDERDTDFSIPAGDQPDAAVGDGERERAAELAGRAYAAGAMSAEELEGLLEELYRAHTAGELSSAMARVPSAIIDEERRARKEERRAGAWRASVRTYLAVMGLLVAVWLVASLGAAGEAHPWFLWPALGWGLPLLASRPGARRGGGLATPMTR